MNSHPRETQAKAGSRSHSFLAFSVQLLPEINWIPQQTDADHFSQNFPESQDTIKHSGFTGHHFQPLATETDEHFPNPTARFAECCSNTNRPGMTRCSSSNLQQNWTILKGGRAEFEIWNYHTSQSTGEPEQAGRLRTCTLFADFSRTCLGSWDSAAQNDCTLHIDICYLCVCVNLIN